MMASFCQFSAWLPSRKKVSDHVYSGKAAGDLKAGRLTKVRGVLIKSEWGQRVSPLTTYPVSEFEHSSLVLHQKHQSFATDGRIVEQVSRSGSLTNWLQNRCLQRQTVEQVPVTVVNYGPKRRQSCMIYGKEMQVYFPTASPMAKIYDWLRLKSCA